MHRQKLSEETNEVVHLKLTIRAIILSLFEKSFLCSLGPSRGAIANHIPLVHSYLDFFLGYHCQLFGMGFWLFATRPC